MSTLVQRLGIALWLFTITHVMGQAPKPNLSGLARRDFDLVVVEATPGGIAMAVRAAREGLSVLLVNHNAYFGGMTNDTGALKEAFAEGQLDLHFSSGNDALSIVKLPDNATLHFARDSRRLLAEKS